MAHPATLDNAVIVVERMRRNQGKLEIKNDQGKGLPCDYPW